MPRSARSCPRWPALPHRPGHAGEVRARAAGHRPNKRNGARRARVRRCRVCPRQQPLSAVPTSKWWLLPWKTGMGLPAGGVAALPGGPGARSCSSGHENPHGRNCWLGRVVAGHLGQGFLLWRTQSGRPFWTMRCERVLALSGRPCDSPGLCFEHVSVFVVRPRVLHLVSFDEEVTCRGEGAACVQVDGSGDRSGSAP
jgi:hypothetical protein